jgi:hypothetical protein
MMKMEREVYNKPLIFNFKIIGRIAIKIVGVMNMMKKTRRNLKQKESMQQIY